MGTDRVINLNEFETTVVLECPYCGKGRLYAYDYKGGRFSGPCGRCKRMVLWDFDNKIAYKASAKKFAS